MKRLFVGFTLFFLFTGSNIIFAQDDDDDFPYLSDDDIAALEMVLPEDIPELFHKNENVVAAEPKTEVNEISRINTSQSIYHLLILDRTYCKLNSDISDLNGIEILYKYTHGINGYLIAIYRSSENGPIFPKFPDKSRILVDLITVRKSTLKDFVESGSFRRFVTSRKIRTEILNLIKTIR
jgi:hypothetical protein